MSNARTTILGSLAVLLLSIGSLTQAQEYPARPITVILPFGAGGPAEPAIRRFAAHFEKTWGKPMLIDARPGAGGLIGSEVVVKAAPDGHTLMWSTPALPAFKALYKELRFDPIADLAPISMLIQVQGGLITNTHIPVRNIDEFVAYAKANPGKLNYASVGRTTQYMLIEALKRGAGINLTEIQFKTQAEIVQALLRDDVHLMQLPLDKAMRGQVEAGKMRPLLMVGDRRAPLFPEIPTAAEKGWNIPDNGIYAMFAPAATPKPIIDKLAAEIARFAALPETRTFSEETGLVFRSSTPEQLRQFMERDSKLWSSTAASVGLQPQ